MSWDYSLYKKHDILRSAEHGHVQLTESLNSSARRNNYNIVVLPKKEVTKADDYLLVRERQQVEDILNNLTLMCSSRLPRFATSADGAQKSLQLVLSLLRVVLPHASMACLSVQ